MVDHRGIVYPMASWPRDLILHDLESIRYEPESFSIQFIFAVLRIPTHRYHAARLECAKA